MNTVPRIPRTPRSPYRLPPKQPRPSPQPKKPLIEAMDGRREASSLAEWLRLMVELSAIPLLLLLTPLLWLARLLATKLLQRL